MDMEQVAAKIQKLLALAGNNPDAAEARAALLKAQELMAKYSLDENQLNPGESLSYDLLVSKASQHKLNNALGHIIAKSFACEPLIYNKKVGFFGREDNAKAAMSAMDFALVLCGAAATRLFGTMAFSRDTMARPIITTPMQLDLSPG